MELKERLKKIRLERRLKQEVVASELNITQAYYSHMERGTRGISLDIIERLAIFYNTTIEEIVHYGDHKVVEEATSAYNIQDNTQEAIIILRKLEQKYFALEREIDRMKIQISKLETRL